MYNGKHGGNPEVILRIINHHTTSHKNTRDTKSWVKSTQNHDNHLKTQILSNLSNRIRKLNSNCSAIESCDFLSTFFSDSKDASSVSWYLAAPLSRHRPH